MFAHGTRSPQRSRHDRAAWLTAAVIVALMASGRGLLSPAPVAHAATAYYVNCSAANNGNGSQGSPWNALAPVESNTRTFGPGDQILFARGSHCLGILAPGGVGSNGSPITIDAYGSGPLPIIDAGGAYQEAIFLYDQEYWTIQDIDARGGSTYGIRISANNSATLHSLTLDNLTVHDIGGQGALILVGGTAAQPSPGYLDGVLIDHVTAYNNPGGSGILVGAGQYPYNPGNNVTVQFSTVHDVGGSAIVIEAAQSSTEQFNVSYNVGTETSTPANTGTPNAIWTFNCTSCTVQYNEAYLTHSEDPSQRLDGGSFDIDYGSSGTSVQYNYGHDNDGYCVAVLSSDGLTEVNSLFRYNVCANNERNSSLTTTGDVFFSSFTASFNPQAGPGSLNGVAIYNNTFVENPAADHATINTVGAQYSGSNPDYVENNLVVGNNRTMVNAAGIYLNHNLYYTYNGNGPLWTYNGTSYNSFAGYSANQDYNSVYAEPKLVNLNFCAINGGVAPACPTGGSNAAAAYTLQQGSPAIDRGVNVGNMGTHDFANNLIPQGGGYDIGALESH